MKSKRFLGMATTLLAGTLALFVCAGCAGKDSTGTDNGADTTTDTTTTDTQQTDTTSVDQQSDGQTTEGTTTEDAHQVAVDTAKSLGYQVFDGTVHVGSPEDVLAWQGSDMDPSVVGYGGTYAILVFDQETEVTGMSADGTGERTNSAKVLGIAEYTEYDSFTVEYGDIEMWKSYDGQHVTLAAKAGDIVFPSDVRLPLGEPAASSVNIIE